jgi:hypothetical protein
MVPKTMGVVVAFFQKLHIVHLCLGASLLFEFSYHVKILSNFFLSCQGDCEATQNCWKMQALFSSS